MIVMAIDPGSKVSGFAIGQILPKSTRVDLIAHGDIQLKAGALPIRMSELEKDICGLILGHSVQFVVYEEPFFFTVKNKDALLSMAASVLACQKAALINGLKFETVGSSQWRKVLGIKKPNRTASTAQGGIFPLEEADLKKICRNQMIERYGLGLNDFQSLDHAEAIGILTAVPKLFEIMT
jgi:Holliday junction resolvasome RuvABC endonuclease subunit